MKSKGCKSLITTGVFLVACGLLAWPGTAAAWGGGSIVFRHGSGHFGHRHTVFFPGTLFRHHFGHDHRVHPGHPLRHRHRFGRHDFRHRRCFDLRHRHLHGGFNHGQRVLIFRR